MNDEFSGLGDDISIRTMRSLIRHIKTKMVSIWKIVDEVARRKAVGTLEYEVEELENIFCILVLGTLIGIPSPPIHITMELFPEMEKELGIMLERVSTAHDPLGNLFSVLGIE